MSMHMNEALLLGRLGKDPEFASTQGGREVVKCSLCTNEVWRDGAGNRQEAATWHNIVIWNKGAIALVRAGSGLRKGDEVLVRGKISHRSYTDKSNVERWVSEVVLGQFSGDLRLIGGRKDAGGSGGDGAGAGSSGGGFGGTPSGTDDLDDDVPF